MLTDSVRASSVGGPLRLSYLVALAFGEGTQSNETWINIARTGQWQGHPAGPFEFTPQVFDKIVDNAKSRQTPINCDYEHQTFRKLTGGIPSAGRILKVERRGDELWALVELTDRAASMVRSGEYRTCSPVIEFDSKDRTSNQEIGPELLSLALTNDPFQDGLHPIRLTRFAMADMPPPAAGAAADEKKKKEAAAAAADGTACMSGPAAGAAPSGAAPQIPVTVMATPVASTDPSAPATGTAAEGSPAEEAAETPAEEQQEGDADAVFSSIADAAGVDKATVLGWIADNLDKLVNLIQAGVAQDGTAADNSKAMSRVAAAVGDIRALKVELGVKERNVVALTNKVQQLSGRLEEIENRHKAENEKRIKAHVVELQAKGHVGPEQQDQDDAVFLFTSNWDRAARTYSRQIVPVGTMESQPERNDRGTGPVTLDNLTEREQRTVEMMVRAGVVKDAALEKIGELRAAGKGN